MLRVITMDQQKSITKNPEIVTMTGQNSTVNNIRVIQGDTLFYSRGLRNSQCQKMFGLEIIFQEMQ